MHASPDRHVSITGNGRSGSVIYREPAGTLSFYWEFGGADVLAILQVEDAAAWKAGHPWIGDRRAEILRFVADEVIRQKARAFKNYLETCRPDRSQRGKIGKSRIGEHRQAV